MKVSIAVVAGPLAGPAMVFSAPDSVVLGHAPDCRWGSPDPALGRYHAIIEVAPPAACVRALGGAAITVNGASVNERDLYHGDRLVAGATTFAIEVRDDDAPASAPGPLDGVPGLDAGAAPLVSRSSRYRIADVPVDAAVVRCGRCGDPSRTDPPRARVYAVAHVCGSCRKELLADPIVPPNLRLVRLVSQGETSSLFEAEHRPSGERRAVEFVIPEASMTGAARMRLVAALVPYTRFRHPRVVALHDVTEVRPGVLALVSAWVDGAYTEPRRSPGATLGLDHVAEIARGSLEGLAEAHKSGIVHRGLRESDLLLQQRDRRIDVGIVGIGVTAELQLAGVRSVTSVRAPMDLVHLAPEVLLDFRNPQPASDLYSVGAIMYRMLTGASPCDGDHARDPVTAALVAAVVPMGARRVDLPAPLVAVIERALYRDPARRFRSAAAMLAAIEGAMA